VAGACVALLSVLYNFLVYTVFGFYPDFSSKIGVLGFSTFGFYLILFVKNFFVGFVLAFFFITGVENIEKREALGIVSFIAFAIFALLAFSLGDLFLMGSNEKLLVLLTVDGPFETLIATMPMRLFVIYDK